MSSHLDYEINKELGECYLFMGELDKAEEYYAKAAGNNGVHPEPYMGLATVAVHRGDLDRAMELYRKAASIQPTDRSLAGMGLIEIEHGRHGEAFDHFIQALDMNPENMVALYSLIQLGHVLERLDQVVPRLQNYLALDADKIEIRYALAGCLVSLGNKEQAKTELDEILARDPQNAKALELLGQL
jgi:tetratricopeptide (TPR) repeat protein